MLKDNGGPELELEIKIQEALNRLLVALEPQELSSERAHTIAMLNAYDESERAEHIGEYLAEYQDKFNQTVETQAVAIGGPQKQLFYEKTNIGRGLGTAEILLKIGRKADHIAELIETAYNAWGMTEESEDFENICAQLNDIINQHLLQFALKNDLSLEISDLKDLSYDEAREKVLEVLSGKTEITDPETVLKADGFIIPDFGY